MLQKYLRGMKSLRVIRVITRFPIQSNSKANSCISAGRKSIRGVSVRAAVEAVNFSMGDKPRKVGIIAAVILGHLICWSLQRTLECNILQFYVYMRQPFGRQEGVVLIIWTAL